jgi:hypothetical protein
VEPIGETQTLSAMLASGEIDTLHTSPRAARLMAIDGPGPACASWGLREQGALITSSEI